MQADTLSNFLFLGLSASFRLGEVEHLIKQLKVVVVDDGEVFGDIDICNFVIEMVAILINLFKLLIPEPILASYI